MPRTHRITAVVAISLSCTVAACVAAGCAASSTSFDDVAEVDASKDAAKDARAKDSSLPDPEDASVEEEDSSTPEPEDAGAKDASSTADGGDAGDGGDGGDAGDAGDAGTDASDAGDAGDAGDSGDAGGGGVATKPLQGEVVISEVLFNASAGEPDTEWIEIYNATAAPKLLSGLILQDGADRKHTIGAGVTIAAGAYAVLANNTAAVTGTDVPAGVIIYQYGNGAANGIQMANSASGSIVLLDGATEIARAKYGPGAPAGLGLSSANNQSIQLKVLTYAGAGLAASWCKSANPWAAGSDNGTPGAASDCP